MRAYRPGLMGGVSSGNEDYRCDREEELRLYTERASEGLPLFEPAMQSMKVQSSDKFSSVSVR